MDMRTHKRARLKLAPYACPNDSLAYLILGVDLVIYLAAVFFAVTSESIAAKLLFSSLAGFMIAQLFVIGHDAAHQAFVSSAKANVVIARLTFMPSLHNYTLWLFAHNRLHHAYPNVQNYNSWSPLSLDEYQAMSRPKQLVQKIYRSSIGFGPYYIFERWLKDKFIPRRHLPAASHKGGWRDFTLLALYSLFFVGALVGVAMYSNQSALLAVLFGAVIPFVIWNYAMGMTIYQHHTHPAIKWYKTLVKWRESVSNQGEVTVHVKYPTWYNFITHNIYIHPVHHVNSKVPLYYLPQAQKTLVSDFSGSIITVPFSLKGFIETVNSCKLYDYEQHQWLDFKGVPTTSSLLEREKVRGLSIVS